MQKNHHLGFRLTDNPANLVADCVKLDTFCEILPYNKFPKDDPSVIGVILSGSPYSVHDPEAFQVDLSQFVGKVPVLGICYGAQYISHKNGGKVEQTGTREYGRANLATVDTENPLFYGFDKNSQVWMSHRRYHYCHSLRLQDYRLYKRR